MPSACDKKIEHRSKGQGQEQHENHCLSHNFLTGNRRDFWLVPVPVPVRRRMFSETKNE